MTNEEFILNQKKAIEKSAYYYAGHKCYNRPQMRKNLNKVLLETLEELGYDCSLYKSVNNQS